MWKTAIEIYNIYLNDRVYLEILFPESFKESNDSYDGGKDNNTLGHTSDIIYGIIDKIQLIIEEYHTAM